MHGRRNGVGVRTPVRRRFGGPALALLPLLAAGAALVIATGCDRTPAPGGESIESRAASPNASILPVPLSAAPQSLPDPLTGPGAGSGTDTARPESSSRFGVRDAMGPALPFRSDQPADMDVLAAREMPGLTLQAEWRYPEPAPVPRAPEMNNAILDALRKATQPAWAIDLSANGRMRMVFLSRGFPLEAGTELRARIDRYGHILVFPDLETYRVLPAGSVRTLLDELRVDAVPLLRAQISDAADGGRRFGFPVRRWELSARSGKLTLEQAKIPGSGDGGILLCRTLCELISADPETAPCLMDEVPVRAQFSWPGGQAGMFEVTAVNERLELGASQLLCPPATASFAATGLPAATAKPTLSREELASFRLRPFDTGIPAAISAPSEGLLAVNGSDLLHAIWIDGAVAAWIAPGGERHLAGLLRGRYAAQWRSFLGDSSEPLKTVEVPGRYGLKTPPEPTTRERESKSR